jgi:hypothetical protein
MRSTLRGIHLSTLYRCTVLFGWIDLDGDAVPEILDPAPYGRQ